MHFAPFVLTCSLCVFPSSSSPFYHPHIHGALTRAGAEQQALKHLLSTSTHAITATLESQNHYSWQRPLGSPTPIATRAHNIQ